MVWPFKKFKEYEEATYNVNSEQMYKFLSKINVPFHNCRLDFWAKRTNDSKLKLCYEKNKSLFEFEVNNGERKEIVFNNQSLESSLKKLLNETASANEVEVELAPYITDRMVNEGSLYNPFFSKMLIVLENENFVVDSFHFHFNIGDIYFNPEGLRQRIMTEENMFKYLKEKEKIHENSPTLEKYKNIYNLDKLQKLTELFNNLRNDFEVKNKEPKI